MNSPISNTSRGAAMELSRYSIGADPYILEEVLREYKNADSKGRIGLVRKIYRQGYLPFEIALQAIEDPSVEVRQWMARNGRYLDYREEKDGDEEAYEFPDRNLVDRLRSDPDPLVRACLCENPEVELASNDFDWEESFLEATHLERLALVRNPSISGKLIEQIFDLKDETFGIEIGQRVQLAMAFLTNTGAIRNSMVMGSKSLFRETLWESASQWPSGTGVPDRVYQYVKAGDHIKAKIYQSCNSPVLRWRILESCKKDDSQTIELGINDTDEICRRIAHSLVQSIAPQKLEELLKGHDCQVLGGLANNSNLSVVDLERIGERCLELDDSIGTDTAKQTIKRIRKERTRRTSGQLPRRQNRFVRKHLLSLHQEFEVVKERLLAIEQKLPRVLVSIELIIIFLIALLILLFIRRF